MICTPTCDAPRAKQFRMKGAKKLLVIGSLVASIAGPIAVASPASAACPTGDFMGPRRASIVSRLVHETAEFDNRNRSTTMTGRFTITTQRTTSYTLSTNYSLTTSMSGTLWGAAEAKVDAEIGVSFSASHQFSSEVGRYVNASVPPWTYYRYYYGVSRVQVSAPIYRNYANCTTVQIGTATLIAPVNNPTFWSARIA